LKDVIDQRIPLPENRVAEGLVYIIKIAFACLLANPQSRPTMRQVASELIARWPPLPKSFSAVTLEDLMPQTTVTGWEFSKRFCIISMWLFLLMLLSIFVLLFVINYFSALYFVSSTIWLICFSTVLLSIKVNKGSLLWWGHLCFKILFHPL
jgi:hypothetical protein